MLAYTFAEEGSYNVSFYGKIVKISVKLVPTRGLKEVVSIMLAHVANLAYTYTLTQMTCYFGPLHRVDNTKYLLNDFVTVSMRLLSSYDSPLSWHTNDQQQVI